MKDICIEVESKYVITKHGLLKNHKIFNATQSHDPCALIDSQHSTARLHIYVFLSINIIFLEQKEISTRALVHIYVINHD